MNLKSDSLKKVLIIEDDKSLSELVQIHLSDLNCEVVAIDHGENGLKKAIETRFDLIILDIMLPGIDGIEICRRLRKLEGYVPILMLTAKSEEIDKVLGLEIGADDYMTKPFSIRELIARVKAIFRRVEALGHEEADEGKPLVLGNLVIDPGKRKVSHKGDRVDLTAKEFDLLILLASNPGRSFTREQILLQVWNYNFSGYEHTVNTHINRLRAKIETDMAQPKYILTIWGVGYRFAEPGEIEGGP